MALTEIIKELKENSSKEKAIILQSFFKTKKGEYGEGDVFLGINVPTQRKIVQKYYEKINLSEIKKLIYSKYHEFRLTGFLLLLKKYQLSLDKKYFEFAVKNLKQLDNWDLVDVITPKLIGHYCYENNKSSLLIKLSKSNNLWEKRIAIISTLYYIKNEKFSLTFKIAKNLENDSHDLIHKAVGWMLREVGKIDLNSEEFFLKENQRYKRMPRTMLRYSIERFPEVKRKKYLNGDL